jgi:hypothetical protein
MQPEDELHTPADDEDDEWDRQIERDVLAGRLDRLAEQALRDDAEGKTTPI